MPGHGLRSSAGSYALVLHSRSRREIEVGRWGRLSVVPGYYVYVGSAFGSGGIRSRVSRHYRRTKRRHWHVDYLREAVSFVQAWISYEPVNQEHRWAAAFAAMQDMNPIRGFGCSDCSCRAHLFASDAIPEIRGFSAAAGCALESWP